MLFLQFSDCELNTHTHTQMRSLSFAEVCECPLVFITMSCSVADIFQPEMITYTALVSSSATDERQHGCAVGVIMCI